MTVYLPTKPIHVDIFLFSFFFLLEIESRFIITVLSRTSHYGGIELTEAFRTSKPQLYPR